MEYSPEEVNVSDPVYVVRKRLGQALENTDSREETIQAMEDSGKQTDEEVYSGIVTDYEQEIGDVLSDFDGSGMMGGLDGVPPMASQQDLEDDGDMSDEEQKRKMKKFMRVSSLQIAYQAYPVFKSIVVN